MNFELRGCSVVISLNNTVEERSGLPSCKRCGLVNSFEVSTSRITRLGKILPKNSQQLGGELERLPRSCKQLGFMKSYGLENECHINTGPTFENHNVGARPRLDFDWIYLDRMCPMPANRITIAFPLETTRRIRRIRL